jgi:hypothetical protein
MRQVLEDFWDGLREEGKPPPTRPYPLNAYTTRPYPLNAAPPLVAANDIVTTRLY